MTGYAALDERIRARIDRAGECWLWIGYVKDNGYGSLTIDGRTQHAHRLVYAALVGPIPEGAELDHLCRVRNCVNPEHLEPVSKAENCYRGQSVPGRRHRQTHCQHGHEFTPGNTAVSSRGHRRCRACDAARARRIRAERSAA